MAHVAIVVTTGPELVSFSGIDLVSDQHIYPRGRIRFRNAAFPIAAKGAGDTQSVRNTLTLPAGFAYALESASIVVSSAANDSFHYAASCYLNIRFDNTGDDVTIPLTSGYPEVVGSTANGRYEFGVTGAGEQKIYSPIQPLFGELFFNLRNISPVVRFTLNDVDGTNATAAMTGSWYLSFLQYTLQQAVDVSVNTPRPTVVR